MNSHPHPLIVTGSPRTGTTALCAGLSQHPRVCIFNELCLYHPQPWAAWRVTQVVDGPHIVNSVPHVWPQKCPPYDEAATTLRVGMSNAEVRSWLFRETERRMGAGLLVYGDNMPGAYLKHLGTIMEREPGARLVVTIRDGRDVVASQLRNFERPTEFGAQDWRRPTVRDAEPLWLKYMLAWEHWRERIDPARWIELRYEEAVLDVDGLLRRLLGFAEVPFEPAEHSAFRAFYRPTHVGAWRESPVDVEASLSPEFHACLRRWGY
ncbi:sulfotransferase family protein [Paraliomyxa miuraensis]|uniref:sulfotransferase family protein n=1 Tax=Paraliomyxa miuraensis TaxID=376150 RepID=UPI00224E35DD|nr:sulfotransferase [Paraliomyxa miuraensis]MCX4242646.1 sulfotransferase [Paraliomyxa miuraensis]